MSVCMPWFRSMRKRAKVQTREDSPEQPLVPQHTRAGENLRACLLDRFTMGAITGSDVAELSYHITQAGGMGVSDLALRPEVAKSHGHAHVRRTAGKFFPEPDVTYIDTPLFLKREVRRVNEKVPMMLPSKLFELFVEKPEVMSKSAKRYELFTGLPCFEEHPVVLNARSQGIPVRPIALYWDGVSYSVHDSFTGFFVTDLLSEQKFLSFLLSNLRCMQPPMSLDATAAFIHHHLGFCCQTKEARICVNVDAVAGVPCIRLSWNGPETFRCWPPKTRFAMQF